jgi:hypothetical protein
MIFIWNKTYYYYELMLKMINPSIKHIIYLYYPILINSQLF